MRSLFWIWNANASVRRGRAGTSRRVSRAASMTTSPSGSMAFIVAIARPCALVLPSLISASRTLAHLKNGPVSRVRIWRSPPARRRALRLSLEHEEVGESAAVVEAPDRLGEQGCSGQDLELVPCGGPRQPERRHAIGNDEPFDGGITQDLLGARHEQPMRDERQD